MIPGLHFKVTAAEYHRDPCSEPSLSSSIARTLIEASPWHAWHEHVRLGGKVDRNDPTREQEFGSAAHKMLLGRGAEIYVIDATDYKKTAAKEARVAAYAAGWIPILRPDLDRAEAMVKVAREQMASYAELVPLAAGQGASEVVAIWQDGGVYCRSMIDWLAPQRDIRVDIKTTTASAHPAAVSSRLFGTSCEVQDRFYDRGLRALNIKCERSLFVMIEADPPHALSVVELDYHAQELGDIKVNRAIEIWRKCMATGQWPGYEPRIAVAELPKWHANNWMNRELAADAIKTMEEIQSVPKKWTDVLA